MNVLDTQHFAHIAGTQDWYQWWLESPPLMYTQPYYIGITGACGHKITIYAYRNMTINFTIVQVRNIFDNLKQEQAHWQDQEHGAGWKNGNEHFYIN